MNPTIFETMVGRPARLALAEAWHDRVMADPVVSHAFHAGVHEHHTPSGWRTTSPSSSARIRASHSRRCDAGSKRTHRGMSGSLGTTSLRPPQCL